MIESESSSHKGRIIVTGDRDRSPLTEVFHLLAEIFQRMGGGSERDGKETKQSK